MSVIKYFLAAFILSGCFAPFNAVASYEGSYEDEEFGLFSNLLEFDYEDHVADRGPHEIAKIAALSLHVYRDLELENYENIKRAVPCVKNSTVRVSTVDTFTEYCPDFAVACTKPHWTEIHVRTNGYYCNNRYVLGHEFLHNIASCLDVEGQVDHQTNNIFAWENGVSDWNVNSAEHAISEHPDSECGNWYE